MSHFNLNNGLPRRRYIGPTHGLKTQPGVASLENLGGRIIIEPQMYNHKQKMRDAKSRIDSSLPWAHREQDILKSRYKSTGGSRAGSSVRRSPTPPWDPTTSRASGFRGRLSSSLGEGRQSDITHRARSGIPTSSTSPYSSGARDGPIAYFDCSKLSKEDQYTYQALVVMVSEMPQIEGKCLLEQVYREAKERKLLKAYSGLFARESTPNRGPQQHMSVTSTKSEIEPSNLRDDVPVYDSEWDGRREEPYMGH